MTKKNKNTKKGASAKAKQNKQVVVVSAPKRSINIGRPLITKAMVESVCSRTDPFCDAAFGSKWPDESNARSISLPARAKLQIGTDGSGYGSMLFLPGLTQFYANPSAIVAGVVTFALAMNGISPLGTTPNNYRIVSYGLKVRGVGAPLNATGMLRIRGFGQTTGVDMGAIDMRTYNSDYQYDVPMHDVGEVLVVGKQINATAGFFTTPVLTNPSTSVTTWVSPGWGGVMISIDGGQASQTTLLDIELICHYEFIFPDSDSLQQLAVPTPPFNPTLSAAIAEVKSALVPVAQKGTMEFAKYVGRKALSALGGLLTGAATKSPALAAVAYNAMEVD